MVRMVAMREFPRRLLRLVFDLDLGWDPVLDYGLDWVIIVVTG
jgi:hypothetical protein